MYVKKRNTTIRRNYVKPRNTITFRRKKKTHVLFYALIFIFTMELLATEAVLPASLLPDHIGIFVFLIPSGVHLCKKGQVTSIGRAVIVKNKLDKLELTIAALKLIGR